MAGTKKKTRKSIAEQSSWRAIRHTKDKQNATTKRINCVKTLLVCMNESYMHTQIHMLATIFAWSWVWVGSDVTLRGNIKFAPHTRNTKQNHDEICTLRGAFFPLFLFFSLPFPLDCILRIWCVYRMHNIQFGFGIIPESRLLLASVMNRNNEVREPKSILSLLCGGSERVWARDRLYSLGKICALNPCSRTMPMYLKCILYIFFLLWHLIVN